MPKFKVNYIEYGEPTSFMLEATNDPMPLTRCLICQVKVSLV